MLAWIIVVAWILCGTQTFRYTGNYVTRFGDERLCEFALICNACRCRNCGDSAANHRGYGSRCDEYKPTRPHTWPFVWVGALTMIFWPALVIAGVVKKIAPNTSFFISPKRADYKKIERLEKELL